MIEAESIQAIEKSLHSAVARICHSQGSSGRFISSVVNKETPYENGWHVGMLYSLGRYLRLVGTDKEEVYAAVERAVLYTTGKLVQEVRFPSGAGGLCVMSDDGKYVSLLGTSILACFYGERFSQTGNQKDSDLLKKLLISISEMQRRDGAMFGFYDHSLQMFGDLWDVEAVGVGCLALTYGATCFGRQPWLSMAAMGVANIVNDRPTSANDALPHRWSWLFLAVSRMYPFTLEPSSSEQMVIPESLFYHLFNVCEQTMVGIDGPVPFEVMTLEVAAETLVVFWSVYRLMTATEEDTREHANRSCFLSSKLKRWGQVGLLMVSDAQIKSGPTAGSFPLLSGVGSLSRYVDAVLCAKEVMYGRNQSLV